MSTSPDGKHKVSFRVSGEIRFGPRYYDLKLDGQEVRDRSFWDDARWSPDSRYLALEELDFSENAVNPDIRVLIIDLATWRERFVDKGVDWKTCDLAALPGWKPLWSVSPHEVLETGFVTRAAFSPDGRFLAQAGHVVREEAGAWTYAEPAAKDGVLQDEHREPFLRVLTAEAGTLSRHDSGHARGAQCLAFFPGQDAALFSGGTAADGTGEAKRWHGVFSRTYPRLDRSAVSQVAPLPDGKRLLAACAWDCLLKLVLADTGKILRKFRGHEVRPDNMVTTAAVSADGRLAVSGALDGLVKVWEVETGACLHTIETRLGGILSAALTAQGLIAAGGAGGAVGLWDSGSGAFIKKLKGTTSPIRVVAAGPGGSRIASGSADGRVIVWDVKDGARAASVKAGLPLALAFSPGGDALSIATPRGVERLGLADGRLRALWTLPSASV